MSAQGTANAAAMLLAAGRGERMRPLTDTCPKPLLRVHGQPLLHWHLQALARDGCPGVLINTAWLGAQIEATLGPVFETEIGLKPIADKRKQLSNKVAMPIRYSHEGQDFGHALETAGGICRALPDLAADAGADVFWVLAGDVYAPGFVFEALAVQRFAASAALAHLWLVPNPPHHPHGDFGLDSHSGLALNLPTTDPRERLTYSTIGLYRRALFQPPWCSIPSGNPHGERAALAPLLRAAMDVGRVTAQRYDGAWTDVGTPQRLAQLNA